MTAAERMRRMRARREAKGLKPVVTWVPLDSRGSPASLDVRLLEARSLALHVIAAKRIEAQPELLEVAHRCVTTWRERGSGTPGVAIRAWRKALRLPWPDLMNLMTEQSERAVALRSTTPFFKVLTQPERRRVYNGFRAPRTRVGLPPELRSLIPAALRACTPR